MTGVEPLLLLKLVGPSIARAAGPAATRAASVVFSSWRVRSKTHKARIIAVSEGRIRQLPPESDISTELADELLTYLSSPDFANICLKLAVELLPHTAKTKKQIGEASVIKRELRASLRSTLVKADEEAVEILTTVLFDSTLKELMEASKSYAVPADLSADLRATAVRAAASVASASIRNADALEIGNLAQYWRFETRLRDQVRTAHGSMKLPHAGTTRKVPYSKLFVEPRLTRTKDSEVVKVGIGQKANATSPEYAAVSELLSGATRTVILGDPGGGKSTLTLKLTHDIARGGIAEIPATVPLLIVLRDYADSFKADKLTFVSHLESLCRSPYNVEPPHGAIEYLLLNGRAFVIFDGLDELTDVSVRRQLVESIESFANLYPSTSILVTSRVVGYDEAPLDPLVFEASQLAPLSPKQVEEYALKWFTLDESIDRPRRQELARAFITDSAFVSDLRTNPLMLSLMCGIYSSEHYIPSNRPEVYKKCAELLFERWDKQRGIITPLPFDAHVRLALNALAFWMYSSPKLQKGLKRDELTSFMAKYLREKRFSDEGEAENAAIQFIDFCTGRAWVLTDMGSDRDQGLYGFTHRTFLEYFAAIQLVRLNASASSLFAALLDRLKAAEWDVVAQLALQILGANVEDGSDDFLDMVVAAAASPEIEDQAQVALLSFASRSLGFVVPRPSTLMQITDAVVERARKAFPSDRRGSSRDMLPISKLLECSMENRPSVARALNEALRTRLERDQHDVASLTLAVFLGDNGLHHTVGLVSSLDNEKFWRTEQESRLAYIRDATKAQAHEHAWISVFRATVGDASISEAIEEHGVNCLFTYRIANVASRPPFAYRYWTVDVPHWYDRNLRACGLELPNLLPEIPTPWIAVSPESDEIVATVRELSETISRFARRPTDLACLLMAMPILELTLASREKTLINSWRRRPRRPAGTLLRDFAALFSGRSGHPETQIAVLKMIRRLGANAALMRLVEHWLTGRVDLVSLQPGVDFRQRTIKA